MNIFNYAPIILRLYICIHTRTHAHTLSHTLTLTHICILREIEKKEQGGSELAARRSCYLKPGLFQDLGQSLQRQPLAWIEPRTAFKATEG